MNCCIQVHRKKEVYFNANKSIGYCACSNNLYEDHVKCF